MRVRHEDIEELQRQIDRLQDKIDSMLSTFESRVEGVVADKVYYQVFARLEDYEKGKKIYKALKHIEEIFDEDDE